jgi:hypothetical protein
VNKIKLFESKQIRSAWNETDRKWYFAVVDVDEWIEKRIRSIAIREEEKGQAKNPSIVDRKGIRVYYYREEKKWHIQAW